jgi:small subunit ribosomal protein S8e
MGEESHRIVRTAGGNQKVRIFSSNIVNATDPANGKTKKTTFSTVVENPANPHYVRRNILTRGAIVQTPLGKARITSRPGQDGVLNAILVK